MNVFRKATQEQENQKAIDEFYDSLNDYSPSTVITNATVMELPTVNSAIELISGIVAGLDWDLYIHNDRVDEDDRLTLLNFETGDLLSLSDFRRAIIRDYYKEGHAHVYIERKGSKVVSLRYVDATRVSAIPTNDPIFKDAKIYVDGVEYETYDFITIARDSVDGINGRSIVDDMATSLRTAKSLDEYTLENVENGGLIKGLIQSTKKLIGKSLDNLKRAWNNKFGGNRGNNIMILDEGLEFKSIQNSSQQLQIKELKELSLKELATIFNCSEGILSGKATTEEFTNFISLTIVPLVNHIESAFNKNLLTEKEKREGYRFSISTDGLLKGDILARYQAYEIGINRGFLSRNEIRVLEGNEPVEGLDTFVMSLGNVLFDPKTQNYIIPNTGSTITKEQVENTQANHDINKIKA
ncbi:MAG: phage portal protein [Clostridium baratii]|nr:phage portal protein [Clostridium baratii]